jgi:hypothetical protein
MGLVELRAALLAAERGQSLLRCGGDIDMIRIHETQALGMFATGRRKHEIYTSLGEQATAARSKGGHAAAQARRARDPLADYEQRYKAEAATLDTRKERAALKAKYLNEFYREHKYYPSERAARRRFPTKAASY